MFPSVCSASSSSIKGLEISFSDRPSLVLDDSLSSKSISSRSSRKYCSIRARESCRTPELLSPQWDITPKISELTEGLISRRPEPSSSLPVAPSRYQRRKDELEMACLQAMTNEKGFSQGLKFAETMQNEFRENQLLMNVIDTIFSRYSSRQSMGRLPRKSEEVGLSAVRQLFEENLTSKSLLHECLYQTIKRFSHRREDKERLLKRLESLVLEWLEANPLISELDKVSCTKPKYVPSDWGTITPSMAYDRQLDVRMDLSHHRGFRFEYEQLWDLTLKVLSKAEKGRQWPGVRRFLENLPSHELHKDAFDQRFFTDWVQRLIVAREGEALPKQLFGYLLHLFRALDMNEATDKLSLLVKSSRKQMLFKDEVLSFVAKEQYDKALVSLKNFKEWDVAALRRIHETLALKLSDVLEKKKRNPEKYQAFALLLYAIWESSNYSTLFLDQRFMDISVMGGNSRWSEPFETFYREYKKKHFSPLLQQYYATRERLGSFNRIKSPA